MAQLPPKPDYLRVKLHRRIQRLGALPMKGSVFVLPNRPQAAEDFAWLRADLVADGADALIWAVSPIAGITDEELEDRFRALRDDDYRAIAAAARAQPSTPSREELVRLLERLRRQAAEVRKIDYFASAAADDAERALGSLEAACVPPLVEASTADPDHRATRSVVTGTTWVTRSEVFVDRIASAWLIRRYIDPEAKFKFVANARYRARAGEVRFDMWNAEFTHEGDRCTFETLLLRFGLGEVALQQIAEIVHDIDCKDDKFERPEAAGVELVLTSLVRGQRSDVVRIELGSAIFEGLYRQFSD